MDEQFPLLITLRDAAAPPRGSGVEFALLGPLPDYADLIESRSILTPASGFARRYKFTLNPYSGCRFGCEYCYARFFAPTPEEQEGWGRWVKVKRNAVELLDRALNAHSASRRLAPGDTIYMSTVTDPYQPIEQKTRLTRCILEALLSVQPRLTIQTRSPLVLRDIDLLTQFNHIRVNLTITTDSEEVRLRYEPYCPSIRVRIETAAALRQAGVPIGISISPMLPIADAEAFAVQLADLDADEYVTQYLKPTRSRFRGGSSPEARRKLDSDGWTRERYADVRTALVRSLGPGRQLFEDEEGYAPVK
jgi:DNA repair photolyase